MAAADRGTTAGRGGAAAGVDGGHQGAGIVVAGGGKVWVVVPTHLRGLRNPKLQCAQQVAG